MWHIAYGFGSAAIKDATIGLLPIAAVFDRINISSCCCSNRYFFNIKKMSLLLWFLPKKMSQSRTRVEPSRAELWPSRARTVCEPPWLINTPKWHIAYGFGSAAIKDATIGLLPIAAVFDRSNISSCCCSNSYFFNIKKMSLLLRFLPKTVAIDDVQVKKNIFVKNFSRRKFFVVIVPLQFTICYIATTIHCFKHPIQKRN